MTPALREALAATAAAMTPAHDPWWIIGSAAIVLHGVSEVAVHDVDVLLSELDAHRILPPLGLATAPGVGDARFHSAVFATWRASTLPIEFMAGTRYAGDGGHRLLAPAARERVAIDGIHVFVPARAELIAILRAFGRTKDHARADLLQVRTALPDRGPGVGKDRSGARTARHSAHACGMRSGSACATTPPTALARAFA